MKTRVLIASIINQKSAVLQYFLYSLAALRKEKQIVDFLLIDDEVELGSTELLRTFQLEHEHVSLMKSKVILGSKQDQRLAVDGDEYPIEGLAGLKEWIIRYTYKHRYDALLLVDANLMLCPDTLERLIDADKEIISCIYWISQGESGRELPQVQMPDVARVRRESNGNRTEQGSISKEEQAFLDQMRIPGVYEVGRTGGCTLIRRQAIEQGASFRRLYNLSYPEEERHFSIRATVLGFPLFVDTHCPAFHMDPEQDKGLTRAEQFKQGLLATDRPSGVGISLCMIVKNEEDVLARCLSSVRGVADEIIIVDTGSTDRTKEIAVKFNAVIYDFEWIDDFAAARNFAFDKATKDYIMWLDADDFLKESDRLKWIDLKRTLPPETDSVMMHYHLTFDQNGQPVFSLKRNRLVRRSRRFRWIGAVHEYLDVRGHIIHSDIAVTHGKVKAVTDRNLQIYRRRISCGEKFSPRDLYYFANELKDHSFYEEATAYYDRFLATRQGWVEDQIAACLKQADCYHAMYDRDLQLRSLFRSLEYDLPRAECCCRIGALFMEEERYKQACYWFERATELGDPPQHGGMIEHTAWTWLPWLQLCVCYDKQGQPEKAYACNERARQYQPHHPSVLHNKRYLEQVLGGNKKEDG